MLQTTPLNSVYFCIILLLKRRSTKILFRTKHTNIFTDIPRLNTLHYALTNFILSFMELILLLGHSFSHSLVTSLLPAAPIVLGTEHKPKFFFVYHVFTGSLLTQKQMFYRPSPDFLMLSVLNNLLNSRLRE